MAATCMTAQDLQNELASFAKGLGLSVQELLQSYTTTKEFNTKIESIELDLKKITEVGELDTESIAEKIIKINEIIGQADDEDVKTLLNTLADHKLKIEQLETRVTKVETSVEQIKSDLEAAVKANATDIKANAEAIKANKTAQDAINKDVESRLSTVESEIENFDKDVDDKIAKAIADEQNRTNLLVDDVRKEIAEVDDQVSENADAIDEINNVLNDTTDENGNLVKGIKTRVSDVEDSVAKEREEREAAIEELKEQIAEAGSGACMEIGTVSGLEAANKFREVFGLPALKASQNLCS